MSQVGIGAATQSGIDSDRSLLKDDNASTISEISSSEEVSILTGYGPRSTNFLGI